MAVSSEDSTVDGCALDSVVYGNLRVVTNVFFDESLVIPTVVTKTLTPIMNSRKRDTSLQLAYPLDGFSSICVIEGRKLLGLMVRGRLLHPPARQKFPFDLLALIGGDCFRQGLDDVRQESLIRR